MNLMRRMLKYLFPLVCIIAFCGSADDCHSDLSDGGIGDFAVGTDSGGSSFAAAGSEFCASFPNSLSGARRVNGVSRRGEPGQRHGFAFVKAGKVVNVGISVRYQNIPKIFPSGLSEPSHRLISLRKLII